MATGFPTGLVFPINALPAFLLAGRGVDELCHQGELKAAAAVDYYRQVPADLLFCPSDIVIQAEAMGAPVSYSAGGLPVVAAPAPRARQPRAREVPRMRVNAQVLRRLGREFPGQPRAAMVYGPFTVAGQVAGEQTLLRGTVQRPAEVRALLEQCLALARDYAAMLLETGAQVLWLSDPLAALLPPRDFWALAGQYLARLLAIHEGPTALHICGDTSGILGQMLATGAGGISFDQCLDLLALEDSLPSQVTIIGNLDPVEVLELARPQEVQDQTEDLAQYMGLAPNFSLSSGCAPPPATPLANLRRFVDSGRAGLAALKPHADALFELAQAVHAGRRQAAPGLVRGLVTAGAPPLAILRSGLLRGLRKGGARYEERQCHLPEVLLMVDAFQQGFEALEDRLERGPAQEPQVVLGTVKGDVHEIGKNLVRIVLETQGVRVLDLGVDVPAQEFLAACRRHGARVLGLSAFTSGSRRELGRVLDLARREGPAGLKVVVGGAAVNQQVASGLGAQGYARDALAAARLVKGLLAGAGPAGLA